MKRLIQKTSILFLAIVMIGCSNNDDSAPQPVLSLTDLSISIAENPEINTIIGSFMLIQENLEAPVSFEITEESVPGAITINSQGQLLIANATLFDFEVNPVITGTVKVTSGNISDTASFNIILTDVDEVIPFITKWNLPNDNPTIYLPIYQADIDDTTTYDFTIDWGDGTTGEVTSFDDPDAIHTYVTGGEKTVTITGVLRGFSFGEVIDSRLSFTDVIQWGSVALGNAGANFFECENLTSFSATDVPNLSEVTRLSSMFFKATSFNGNLSNWDVSNITNMGSMFSGATTFNGDISNWDVGNVTDMGFMFNNATSFNNQISSWNVSNVTNMIAMFQDASAFNSDLTNWDVSSVTNMSFMFRSAGAFNGDVSSWSVINVTEMQSMFFQASAFNGDLSNWNTSSLINMRQMFDQATSFNSDLSNWDVSNVSDMTIVFRNASSFNGDISNWNVSNVTEMFGMFLGATAFNGDISNWNLANVVNTGAMFSGATSFNGDISNWNVSNVTNMGTMFQGAQSFNSNISNWDVGNVTDMSFMFNNALSFNQNLSDWATDNVITCNNFANGSSLTLGNLPTRGPCF